MTANPIQEKADIYRMIEEIDWRALTHAYGFALDVPQNLRQLMSDIEVDRKAAFESLFSSICHQGDLFDSTCATIPIIHAILRSTLVADKARLISLIRACSVGVVSDVLYGSQSYIAELEYYRRQSNIANAHFSAKARLALDCYQEGSYCRTTFIKLVNDTDEQIASQAAYTLGCFPQHCQESLPVLCERLNRDVSVMNRCLNLMLTIGWLECQSSYEPSQVERAWSLTERDAIAARACGYIYLLWFPAFVDITLSQVEAFGSHDELDYVGEVVFDGGTLGQYLEFRLESLRNA